MAKPNSEGFFSHIGECLSDAVTAVNIGLIFIALSAGAFTSRRSIMPHLPGYSRVDTYTLYSSRSTQKVILWPLKWQYSKAGIRGMSQFQEEESVSLVRP